MRRGENPGFHGSYDDGLPVRDAEEFAKLSVGARITAVVMARGHSEYYLDKITVKATRRRATSKENTMTRRLLSIGAMAVALSVTMFAAETYDEYVSAMKADAGANGEMRKLLESDLKGAAAAAEEAKAAFEEIEAYWKMKNADDAVMFARNVIAGLEQVHTAAAAGDIEKAMTAAQGIGANCGGCHDAHREKGPDGKFVIK